MRRLRPIIFLLTIGLGACDKGGEALGGKNDPAAASIDGLAAMAVPIRAADCSGVGDVTNLPDDDFLAVREGPGTDHAELARLDPGSRVHLCGSAKKGKWLGVVYRPDGALPDAERCRLNTDDRPAYSGPCRAGWVSARYVERDGQQVRQEPQRLASQADTSGNEDWRWKKISYWSNHAPTCEDAVANNTDDPVTQRWSQKTIGDCKCKELPQYGNARYCAVRVTQRIGADMDTALLETREW